MKKLLFVCLLLLPLVVYGDGVYNVIQGSLGIANAADTNRYSTEVLLKSPLTTGNSFDYYEGCVGWVIVSDISNPGDAAFGDVDTCILTYKTGYGGYERTITTDTLALLPDTSYFWNEHDSLWHFMDKFWVEIYLADSTEDYSGSNETLCCTLSYNMRIFDVK